MISSAGEYQYVTGITNGELLIDGHVMPWREANYTSSSPATDKPECLRGEDICFLYEGAARWMITPNCPRLAYSNDISWSKLVNVYGQILNNGFVHNSVSVISHQKTDTFQKTYIAGTTITLATVNATYGQQTSLSDFTTPAPSPSSPFSKYYIRSLFDDFAKVRSGLVATSLAPSSPVPTETSRRTNNGTPLTTPAVPTAEVIIGESLVSDTAYDATGRVYRSLAIRYDNSSGNMLLDLAPQHTTNIPDVGECVSAIVGITSATYGTAYHVPQNNRILFATVTGSYSNGHLELPFSDIHAIAEEYATTNNVYSQFYTSDRADWPTRTGSCHIYVTATVFGIVTWPDLDWN